MSLEYYKYAGYKEEKEGGITFRTYYYVQNHTNYEVRNIYLLKFRM